MKGDIIPDRNHIARYCGFGVLNEDGEVGPSAFMLKAKDTDEGLSVDWLEFLKRSSRKDAIIEMRNVYASRFGVGTKAKIAILNVGNVRQIVREEKSLDNRELKVLHDPLTSEGDQSPHSGIYNLKHDDDLISELLAQVVIDSPPAKS